MTAPLLAITAAPLDLAGLAATVQSEQTGRAARVDRPGPGAVATFVGTVRDRNQGRRVVRLEYEAYEPLALRAFERIAGEAGVEWPDVVLGIHHRVGTLGIGEASVTIAAAAPHRGQAFAACRYAIERIKQIAPIWKREYFEDGHCWIEGAVADPDDGEARGEARRRACA
jgi:molybdopterin synthase catalytic subunit